MSIIKRIITIAPFLIIIILVSAMVFPAPAEDTYSVVVKYFDDVQITYRLDYPSGGIWMGSGDIPLGGSEISGQVYCADPYVEFHSRAMPSWEDTTIYKMDGYIAAAPWAMSGAMQKNIDAVNWIVLNGYRGDYLADDMESQASVDRLQALYPDIGDIDKTVAIMATKVSIWSVLAGDGIEILKTSLDPARQEVFDNLVDAMVKEATEGNSRAYEAMTSFTVELHEGSSVIETDQYQYIPMTIIAELNSPYVSESAVIDDVFLTVNGLGSGSARFFESADDAALPLTEGLIYGTEQTAQLIKSSTISSTGAFSWESGTFYLRVPLDRGPGNGDQLTVRAMAKVNDVTLTPGTPVTLVYENADGIQDWNYVQAFVGAAREGMSSDLYAETSMHLGGASLGSIFVQKLINNGLPSDNYTQFVFAVYYNPTGNDFSGAVRLDLTAYPVYSAATVNTSVDGEHYFTLSNGGMAFIDGLPSEYYYWVVEMDVPSGYGFPEFSIPVAEKVVSKSAGIEVSQGTSSAAFRMDGYSAMVTSYNSKLAYDIPDTLETTEEETETAEAVETEEITETAETEEAAEAAETAEATETMESTETAEAVETTETTGSIDMPEAIDGPNQQDAASGSLNAYLRIGNVAMRMDESENLYKSVGMRGEIFNYTLNRRASPDASWEPVDLTGIFESQDALGDNQTDLWGGGGLIDGGISGQFFLYHYGLGIIELNPEYEYLVEETETENYFSAYTLASYEDGNWSEAPDSITNSYWREKGQLVETEAFHISPDGYYQLVFLNLDVPSHDITISNTVADGGDNDRLYQFEIVYTGGPLGVSAPWAIPLATDSSALEALIVEGVNEDRVSDTVLSLGNGESATIKSLSAGIYTVRELTNVGYISTYSINSGEHITAIGGETEVIYLTDDISIEYINTLEPSLYDPSDIPGNSIISRPGNAVPQTDDTRNPSIDIILLALGVAILICAELYRKRNAPIISFGNKKRK